MPWYSVKSLKSYQWALSFKEGECKNSVVKSLHVSSYNINNSPELRVFLIYASSVYCHAITISHHQFWNKVKSFKPHGMIIYIYCTVNIVLFSSNVLVHSGYILPFIFSTNSPSKNFSYESSQKQIRASTNIRTRTLGITYLFLSLQDGILRVKVGFRHNTFVNPSY